MHPDPTRSRHRQPTPSGRAVAIAARPEGEVRNPPGLKPLSGADEASVHELLVATQQQAHTVQQALDRLVKLAEGQPADMRLFNLSVSQSRRGDDVGDASKSFGVYNPSDALIYVGLGQPARPGIGALTVPARTLLVLPIPLASVEVGVDPTDAAVVAAGNTGINAWLLRYGTAQPAFFGAIA